MCASTRTIDLSTSPVCFAMANSTKSGTGKFMADGCADTSIAAIGNGFVEVARTEQLITLVGFDKDLTKPNIPIGSAAAAVDLPTGTIIIQLNETPLLEGGSNSLLSTAQAREFGVIVDDVAKRHGGKQHIQADNRVIPMKLNRSLLYVPIRNPTDWELSNLQRIHLTSEQPWDPANLDDSTEGQVIFPSEDDLDMDDYLRLVNFASGESLTNIPDENAEAVLDWIYNCRRISPTTSKPGSPPDLKLLTSKFGFVSEKVIENTLAATTQLATNVLRLPLRRHFKSRYPQLNRPRLREEYCTDTFFSSVTGIGGHNCAQVFVGRNTKYGAVYGLASEHHGNEALEQFIADHGAPFHIRSDNAQMELSKNWRSILRKYNISSSTTEPHHSWQNHAERRIQEYKKGVNRILDRTGAPSNLWFYALLLWVGIMNVLADPTQNNRSPYEAATGMTPDVSAFMQFTFYDPIYYYDESESFPSSKEQLGYWLGPASNCGDALTYWILTEKNTIIARSTVRPANDPSTFNHRRSPPFRREGGKQVLSQGEHPAPGLVGPTEVAESAEHCTPNAVKEPSPSLTTGKELLESTAQVPHQSPSVDLHKLIGYHFVHEHDGTTQCATVAAFSEEDGKFLVEYFN